MAGVTMRETPYPVPKSWPWQVAWVGFYLLMAGCGGVVTAYIFMTEPVTAAGRMILIMWAGATLVPGLVCAFGVIRDRYRWEWIGCWPLSAGIGVYAASVWLGMSSIWDLANTLLITAIALVPLSRAIHLGIVDRNKRRDLMRQVAEGVGNG